MVWNEKKWYVIIPHMEMRIISYRLYTISYQIWYEFFACFFLMHIHKHTHTHTLHTHTHTHTHTHNAADTTPREQKKKVDINLHEGPS